MNNNSNTLLSKLGFEDDDFKNPKHDDIVLWATKYAQTIIDLTVNVNIREKYKDEYEAVYEWDKHLLRHLTGNPPIGQRKIIGINLFNCVWEHPIKAKNNYIVGFADLHYKSKLIYEMTNFDTGRKKEETTVFDTYFDVFFEIKTSIRSAGELIRQIRTYQTYTQGYWIVVSPDNKYEQLLTEQGIYFYKYE